MGVKEFIDLLGMSDGLTPEGVFTVIALAIILKGIVNIAYGLGNLSR